ncbi:glycosyltransferase [Candidatus Cloacimonadota bacterium]
MRVFFASYPSLSLNRGGPTYKIKYLKKALEEIGVEVILYDPWDLDIRIEKSDIFHIFNASLSTYPLAVNLETYGAKYVVNPIFFSNHKALKIRTYMNLERPYRKIFKRSYSDYTFTKTICDTAERVLPNTKAEGDLLIEGLGVDKNSVQVIYNGVEKRFYNSDPSLFQKEYGLKDFVLYVGHLGPLRKNGLNIVKALKKLDCPSVIIGDVLETREGRECLKEIESAENILFLNWVKHDDELLSSAYAACHTFILPTRYETPGRAALEAGLAGANVVITPYGGTKEYFEDLVLYCNPHSVSDIVKNTEEALNKKKNQALREHILKKFIWEKIAGPTLKVYKEVM